MSISFDSAMDDLIQHIKKIFEKKAANDCFATKKEKKKNNPLKFVESFHGDYTLSDEQDNIDDVMASYKKYRNAILRGWKVDAWLKAVANVSIYSGALDPDETHKLPLSQAYQVACQLRDETRATLQGLPVEAYEDHEELLYPSFFMLYLYRLFYASLPEESEDKVQLKVSIDELEKELKLKEVVVTGGGEFKMPAGMEGLQDTFMGFAKDLGSKMGYSVPDNLDLSQGGALLETGKSLMSRPETQSFLGDLISSFQGSKDFGEGMARVMNKMQDPSTVETFQKIVGEAASTMQTENKQL